MGERNRLLKWSIVIVPVVAALLSLWPPEDRLKGGIDLVGGTSLLFEIDTAGMASAQKRDLAERVINILKARVDPRGQMNLVWRPIGNNRIEIQMPRPPARAAERRKAYEAAMAGVQALNVTRMDLEAALNAPQSERPARLDGLVHGVASRKPLLEEAAAAFDAYHKVRGGDDVDAEYAALTRYEEAVQAVLDTSVEAGRLTDVLALGVKKRPAEVKRFVEVYPAYSEAIAKVVAAYDAWAADKGALEDPSDLKRRIRGAGVLEFRILAERDPSNPTRIQSEDPALRLAISDYVEQLQKRGPRPKDERDPFRWFPIKDAVAFTNLDSLEEFEKRRETLPQIIEPYLGRYYVLAHNGPNYGLTKEGSGRWELSGAYPSYDSRSGRPAVNFTLDARGARRFGRLTGDNLKRQLCIFLDGVAQSHAEIQSQIWESGQITGNFSQEEIAELVQTLEAGSLPARVKETPLMEKSVGPSLGERNRTMGMRAASYGLIAVAVFMLIYYMFAGLVADLALALNLLFVLAVMAALEATFTLPGIAGLILTVGMAVDANVLIFERIREERARGVLFKKALRTGYEKAFSTIVDANLTTLITCVILGYVGSEEVKGFAMTLGFGVVTSMFTALFVTRLIFTTLISAGLLKSLPMLRLIGVPRISWLALRKVFWPISASTMVVGISVFAYVTVTHKESLYDIEFLGGTSVQIELKPGEQMNDEQVRQAVTAPANSARAWLRQAADALQSADAAQGNVAGQFTLTTDRLTAEEIGVLMRTTFESHLARGGVSGTGHTAVFDTKPVVKIDSEGNRTEEWLDLAKFRSAVAEAARYVRVAADDRLSGARVQTVRDVGETTGRPDAFEIVTVETDRELVQMAIVAVLGEKLKIESSIDFTLVTDPNLAPEGYYPIAEENRYLDDVVPGAPRYDIQAYKGGLVLVFDNINPPQTTSAIHDRIRELRLLPEYEQYGWRNYEVIGLTEAGEAEGNQKLFRKVALVVSDPNVYYDPSDPGHWREALAQPELAQAKAAFESEKTLRQVLQFDSPVAKRTRTQATVAMILALAAIVAYVWIRFGTMRYGLAAIVALVHDVSITLGLVTIADLLGIGDFRIDLPMIAAVLTIIGYSLNDTIVVFDRIRENRGKLTALSTEMIDSSINQCLSRTLLTSITTFAAVFVMFMWGGPGIHGFSFALLIGVVVGTYSSIGIAAPLLHQPRLLHVVVYVLIAAGLFGLVAEISPRPAILGAGGAIIAIVLAVVIYIEGRSLRTPVPAGA